MKKGSDSCCECSGMMKRVSDKNESPLILECQQCHHRELAIIQISPQGFFKDNDKKSSELEENNSVKKSKSKFKFFEPFGAPVSVGNPGEEQIIIPIGWILIGIFIIIILLMILF